MATILESNKIDAESSNKLDLTLQEALTFGQLQVRVTDDQDPALPIAGAQVEARDGGMLVDQGTTDANGEVTLEVPFSGMPLFATKSIRVVADPTGSPSEKTVTAIAIATIDVDLVHIP